MDAALMILGFAIALWIVSKTLQRKLVDRKKMLSMQEQVKKDRKEVMSLIKEADKNKVRIEEINARSMEHQLELMNMQMKVSLFSLPIFLLALWFLSGQFAGKTLESLIPLPKFNNFWVLNPFSWVPVGFGYDTGYYKAFFFYYIIMGIVFGAIEKAYDSMKEKKEKEKEASNKQ